MKGAALLVGLRGRGIYLHLPPLRGPPPSKEGGQYLLSPFYLFSAMAGANSNSRLQSVGISATSGNSYHPGAIG